MTICEKPLKRKERKMNFIKWKIVFEMQYVIESDWHAFIEHLKDCFFDYGWNGFLGEIFRKNGLRFYPVLMSNDEYKELDEFNGW